MRFTGAERFITQTIKKQPKAMQMGWKENERVKMHDNTNCQVLNQMEVGVNW